MTFTFTDNRPQHKHIVHFTAEELAAHLSKDSQFMYYFRKGWDPRQAAFRSLCMYPPNEKAPVWPMITEERWKVIYEAIRVQSKAR